MNIQRIVNEEVKKISLVNEITSLATKMIVEKKSKKSKKNNKQDEYIAKHGQKEQNAMRGQVAKTAKSDAVNNAAVARQMKRDHPGMKIDSSYISKMTNNKPGYTSGHYHWDKEKADAYLQATDELGIN